MSTSIRIGVITNYAVGPAFQELKQSADALDVSLEQIKVPFIELSNFSDSELVQKTLSYDAVYYRTGLRDTALDHLTVILKRANIPLINGSEHSGSHRKVQQSLIADAAGILQPRGLSMENPKYEKIANKLGPSFIAKPDFSSHGTDVKLITSQADLTTLIKTTNRDRFIFQELIKNVSEYRVYTLGRKYIASYKKILPTGDFRANLHTGGSMITTEPKYVSLLSEFSAKVADAFQADIAGLDIFIADNTCMFLELNWQPGWENLEAITGINFSDETIKYICKIARTGH